MARCPSCGFNSDFGLFCGKCGERLPDEKSHGTPFISPSPLLSSHSPEKLTTPPKPSPATNAQIEALSQELKQNPASIPHYLKLAEALLKSGKIERAFSTFRAAKAINPDDHRIFRLGGRILERLGRNDEAIAAFQRTIRLNPGDVESRFDSSRLLYNSGKRQKALEVLESLLTHADEHPEILLKIAEIQLSLKDPSAAQEKLSMFRKLAGETRDMFMLLGRAMLGQSFFDGAIKLYREGLARFPQDPDLRLGLGKALLGAGEKRQALLEFEQASQFAPDQVDILLEMGRLYSAMGLDEKAEEIFSMIRKQNVQEGEVFLEIARLYKSRNQFGSAHDDLERARKISPHNPDVIMTLCEFLEVRNDMAKALAEYDSFLQGMPGAVWALQGVIRTARHLGFYKRVANAQKTFIKAGNESPDAWCDLGETLVRLGQFDEAGQAFDQAARLDPSCVRAYQAPELIKIEKARADGQKLVEEAKEGIRRKFWLTAVEKLERALDLVPRETAWVRLLAEVNLRIGSITRAADRLSKVRAAQPNDFWVGFQLARVYDFEEKPQLAIELLSSILKDHPNEIEGQMLLMRLKRGQVQGDRFERDMLAALVRNVQTDFAPQTPSMAFRGQTPHRGDSPETRTPSMAFSWHTPHRGDNPVPVLLEGYVNFLFGMGSKFQMETLKKAEELFDEALYRFPDNIWAHRGLCLVFRSRGDYRKALHHMQEVVKLSSDPGAIYALARLHENFQNYSEARRSYTSLKSLFPDNGLYRRRIIEIASRMIEPGGKDEMVDLISTLQEQLRSEPTHPWTLYEMAWGQTIFSRRSPQREEWEKRALLTWNKVASQHEVSPWVRWGLMEAQSEFLKGPERLRVLNQNLRVCEKLVREFPDLPQAHAYQGICLLGFEDLTQTDRAIKHLETALFLDPSSSETVMLVARCYRTLGKMSRVDVMRQNMLLLEPELALKL